MVKKHLKILFIFAFLISFSQPTHASITMLPNGFDNMLDKLDNFFHPGSGHKEINVPEEEFLENQYLQEFYLEDEKYLEKPEAQQFYKDYSDFER